MKTLFHAPVIPYSPIDALNRRAAEVWGPQYAKAAENADYNGHAVTIRWNEFRSYYVAEYFWAGRQVLARGSLARCLDSAMAYYRRGALGSSVTVALREGDEEGESLCREHGLEERTRPFELPWYTWRHKWAAESVRDPHAPYMARIFDWDLMQQCETEDEYREALISKYGKEWQ